MKLKLVLHVGPHKTGTSSLQLGLAHPIFRQTAAKMVPRAGLAWFRHALAAHALTPTIGTEAVLKDWIEAAHQSECETLIVSAEALSAAYPDKVGAFRANECCDVHLGLHP